MYHHFRRNRCHKWDRTNKSLCFNVIRNFKSIKLTLNLNCRISFCVFADQWVPYHSPLPLHGLVRSWYTWSRAACGVPSSRVFCSGRFHWSHGCTLQVHNIHNLTVDKLVRISIVRNSSIIHGATVHYACFYLTIRHIPDIRLKFWFSILCKKADIILWSH